MSWLLFAISVLFAVFALFDGLSSDDRYPGYGQVARRAQQSRDDYLGELQAIRRQLDRLKEDELAGVERNLQRARTHVAHAAAVQRERKWMRTQLEAALLDAENCLDTLLRIFRDTNQLHRGAAPRPRYFDTRASLQQVVLPDFGADDDRTRLDVQERLLAQLLAGVDPVRANIEATFSAHAEKLKPEARTGSHLRTEHNVHPFTRSERKRQDGL